MPRSLGAILRAALALALETSPARVAQAQPAPGAPAADPAATPTAASSPIAHALPAEPDPARHTRVLGDHRLLVPSVIDTSLVTSHFGMATAAGYYSQADVIQLLDTGDGPPMPFSYDREMAFLEQRVSMGVALFETLGLSLDASYIALIGSNEESIFLFGGDTSYDLRPGVRVRLLRSSRTQIGAHVYGQYGSGFRVRPAGLLERVAADLYSLVNSPIRAICLAQGHFRCAFPGFNALDALRVTQRTVSVGATVSVAHVVTPQLSIQGSVGAETGWTTQETQAAGAVRTKPRAFLAGVAPSVTLSPHFPMAVMLEYGVRVVNEPVASSVRANIPEDAHLSALHQTVGLGLYHAGRDELQLGMVLRGTFATQSIAIEGQGLEDPPARTLTAQIVMRYFF